MLYLIEKRNLRPERQEPFSGCLVKNGLNLDRVVLNLLSESCFYSPGHPLAEPAFNRLYDVRTQRLCRYRRAPTTYLLSEGNEDWGT